MGAGETVAWVRPPEPIRGLDHLGVQAPCIALYGQLLPGITNVTDRARHYSFHPWVLWAFERRYADHSLDEFCRVLRRAECLFALIAIRHARVVDDNDDSLHGCGMVGRDKLMRIEEDSFALEDYATLEGPNRYFKNRLGGLGQYYFGPLRDLRVLDHSPQGAGHPPGYDRERGRELAGAFASAIPEDAFFRVLEQPTATWEELDELAAFCPCGVRDAAAEHEHKLLLDLFLARTRSPSTPKRGVRATLSSRMVDAAASSTSHGPSAARSWTSYHCSSSSPCRPPRCEATAMSVPTSHASHARSPTTIESSANPPPSASVTARGARAPGPHATASTADWRRLHSSVQSTSSWCIRFHSGRCSTNRSVRMTPSTAANCTIPRRARSGAAASSNWPSMRLMRRRTLPRQAFAKTSKSGAGRANSPPSSSSAPISSSSLRGLGEALARRAALGAGDVRGGSGGSRCAREAWPARASRRFGGAS